MSDDYYNKQAEALRAPGWRDDWGDVEKWGPPGKQLFDFANPGDREIWGSLTDQARSTRQTEKTERLRH